MSACIVVEQQVERVLPVASDVEKQAFGYVLSKKAYHSISDGHLWFSIFSRPPSNPFTRVQRCTCCFTLLFISMLLNIMYYGVLDDVKATNGTSPSQGIAIGPLYISAQQVCLDRSSVFVVISELLDRHRIHGHSSVHSA